MKKKISKRMSKPVGKVKTQRMDHGHPRWDESLWRFDGPEGCNFRTSKATGKTTWRCEGGYDKTKAEAILKAMGDIDIQSSMKYFEKNGGHCDCEILFNVAPKGM